MGQKTDGKKTKARKNHKSNVMYYLCMTLLLVVFLGSGAALVKSYLENRGHEADLNEMAALFPDIGQPGAGAASAGILGAGVAPGAAVAEAGALGEENGQPEGQVKEPQPQTIPPDAWKLWWDQNAERRFATYRSLKEQNEDMVGWVRIEGTRIDYPVVQTPDQPDYYLRRDFNKNNSNYGIPYMAETCIYEEPGTNLLIYGHHMKNGGMFAALQNYTEEAFYRQHPYIQFDTVEQAGSYEIVAVVKVDAARDATPWKELLFPGDEAVFQGAWQVFEGQSFYPTGVVPEYGERLLALVTCEYTLEDGRLMVVAREIR